MKTVARSLTRSNDWARNIQRPIALLLAWTLATGPMASAGQQQDTSQPRGDSNAREMQAGFEKRPSSSDLVSENMARVTATADQILAAVNKDSGLMVELKTIYAQEAGLNGQVLEEKDLTDAAVEARLRQDLRLRMLATKLLQRYGYLLPRINPDSDLAEEHTLYLRQKAQEMQRAAARQELGGQFPLAQAAACDPRTDLSCLAAQSSAMGAASGEPPNNATPPQPERQVPRQTPDYSNSPSEIRTASVPQTNNNAQTLLASAKLGDSGGPTAVNPPSGIALPKSVMGTGDLPIPASQSDALAALALSSGNVSPEKRGGPEPSRSGGGIDVEQLLNAYRTGQPSAMDVEPVRMVHQPSPYANVPALYDLYVQAAASNRPTQRFGLDIFQRGAAKTDLLPMDLPVGPDYVVGPGDGLAIDLWGGVSQRLMRTVDREGRVSLPEAGPLLVSGRTLGDIQDQVQRILRTQFRDVSADVSLLRLRTVRVYVVGEVAAPGAYDISSLSTPLNALFTAGGVTPRGSLRQLEHYRGSQLIERVDAYDLLLHGVRRNMQRLESGDSLRVPPLGPAVTVDGMVRRPATYEIRAEKNLEDVLDLAGGILPAAALRHIEVQRLVAHDKRTMFSLDLGEASDVEAVRQQMRHFAVQDGDQIHIFPIAPYNTAAVYLEGHVLRPGRYSFREGMKFTDVIASYKDLLPEPSGRYAEIIRLKAPDYRPVVESFDLTKALENPASAPELEPLDTVRIFGRYDFEAAPEIIVTGEVRSPGRYATSGQQHLRDVLYQAGGVSPDAWLDSAQVFRIQPDGTTKVFSVNLRNALDANTLDNLLLEPRDRVLVHRQPELAEPRSVYVQGDVAHPGRYPLAGNMHASDLIRSAGGLLRSADPEDGKLTQYVAKSDSAAPAPRMVAVNLRAALEGDAEHDVMLNSGDVLTVPEKTGWKDVGSSVSLRGEVRHPGTYGIRNGERLSEVLERAGGFNPDAYPYGAVLTRREVRDLEMKSHEELVQRVKYEEVALKSLPENNEDQKNAKLTAIAQVRTTLDQLQATAPIGRVVIHIQPNVKAWKNTDADPVMRDGDELIVPKKANYVMVTGQVFNPTSINYQPGRSARWYLSQAGGMTQMANRQAAFVIRGDGSVVAAKNNSGGWWKGDPLNTVLKPGDTIIVPEKAPNVGGHNWPVTLQMAQIAASAAFTAVYLVK